MGEGEVQVGLIIRERYRRFAPTAGSTLHEDDVLLLRGDPQALEHLVNRAHLSLAGGGVGDAAVVEGVVSPDSPLLGGTVAQARLEERFALGVLAVSRSGQRIAQRLGSVRLRPGDVVVLRSASPRLPDILGELHVLPLFERAITLGRSKRSLVPVIVLVVAMAAVALKLLPVAIAFFAAAVVLLLLRVMTMHEAYATVEWHVLILLGALIPISHAVRDSGGTNLIASWMEHAVHGMPALGALGLVLVLTMLVTPFLHNAPTVLIMGPDRDQPGGQARAEHRFVPDGGRARGGLRLPHPDWPPVQHTRDGTRGLPVRRLRQAGCAVDVAGHPGRGAADRVVLAAGRAIDAGLRPIGRFSAVQPFSRFNRTSSICRSSSSKSTGFEWYSSATGFQSAVAVTGHGVSRQAVKQHWILTSGGVQK